MPTAHLIKILCDKLAIYVCFRIEYEKMKGQFHCWTKVLLNGHYNQVKSKPIAYYKVQFFIAFCTAY